MFSLNSNKTFNKDNHPFMQGIKGDSYQTFTEWSGRIGYQLSAKDRKDGVFIIRHLGSRPSYTDRLGYNSPTTLAEKAAYFSGRIINSVVSIPFHGIRTIIDITLQILQTIAFLFEHYSAKLKSKLFTPCNPSFPLSTRLASIRNSSGCCGAINQLAERFFLINNDIEIKSFSSIIRNYLLKA